jgi:hypothetical protein
MESFNYSLIRLAVHKIYRIIYPSSYLFFTNKNQDVKFLENSTEIRDIFPKLIKQEPMRWNTSKYD